MSPPRKHPRPSEVPIPRLLSLQEVAQLLGLSRRRIRQLIAHGRIPARKIAGNWRVTFADLAELKLGPIPKHLEPYIEKLMRERAKREERRDRGLPPKAP